jgi:hypothetical protein
VVRDNGIDFDCPSFPNRWIDRNGRVPGLYRLALAPGHPERQKIMLERIFRNWKTTTIGLVVLVVSLVFVWFERATLTEVSIFLMGGFAFLFSNDPKPTNGKANNAKRQTPKGRS